MRNQHNILVIEDDPDLRNLLVFELQEHFARVFQAEGAIEALALLAKEPIHLVLSDIRMPHGNVKHLLSEMQRKVPVILMTGYSDIEMKELYQYGVRKIFEKPINWDEFYQSCEEILSSSHVLKMSSDF